MKLHVCCFRHFFCHELSRIKLGEVNYLTSLEDENRQAPSFRIPVNNRTYFCLLPLARVEMETGPKAVSSLEVIT
jgi:hypothetical protein